MKKIIKWFKQLFTRFRQKSEENTDKGDEMDVLNNYHDSGVVDELGNALAFVIANIATDGVTTRYTVPAEYLRDAGSYVVNVNQTAYGQIHVGGGKYPIVINLRFDGKGITWEYVKVDPNTFSLIRPQITLLKVIA